MPKTLLKKCCVKVRRIDATGRELKQGSGVIVRAGSDYFVITAKHCVELEDVEDDEMSADTIVIEKQEHFNSDFVRITVIEVVELGASEDFVLIKIEDPNLDCDFLRIFLGENFIDDETVHFRGYQSMNADEPRIWKGTVIETSPNEFKIKLYGDTFQTGGEMGADVARGLSGSGVFIIRDKKIYLIGHLKSVIGEIALNNDIKCCNTTNLKHRFTDLFRDMGDIDELEIWSKASKKTMTDEDIDKWANDHNGYFDNINRKANIIFPSADTARENVNQRIIDFLDQEYQNNSIRNRGDLISRYDSSAETFEKTVKAEYSRSVASPNEAKDLVLRLETAFKEHIKDLINDKSNVKTMELARHKVTWWLMNCSLEFKD